MREVGVPSGVIPEHWPQARFLSLEAAQSGLPADGHPSLKPAPCPSETAQRISFAGREMLLLTP